MLTLGRCEITPPFLFWVRVFRRGLFPDSLNLFPCLVRWLSCRFGFRRGGASFPARPFWSEAVLRGLFALQDRPAGTANGDGMFDFFGADRAVGHRRGIVPPGLFAAELTRCASV